MCGGVREVWGHSAGLGSSGAGVGTARFQLGGQCCSLCLHHTQWVFPHLLLSCSSLHPGATALHHCCARAGGEIREECRKRTD